MAALSEKPPIYYSYILRCWVEAQFSTDGTPLCRYSLEDPHTGERLLFASLDMLAEFLNAKALACGTDVGLTKDENVKRKT